MALGATLYNIDIDLADADRHVYESLALRVARHPSESEEHLVARVLAYAMEFTDGIAFSPGGLSDSEQPAIAIRDLTGAVTSWIEIGHPDPAKLHKASKAAPRVAVYTHKDPDRWADHVRAARIFRAEALEVYALDRTLIGSLTDRLDRRMSFALAVTDRELFVSIGSDTLNGAVPRVSL